MKDITSTLRELLRIYHRSRAAGHTYAMLNGALNSEQCKIACLDYKHAQTIGVPRGKELAIGGNPDRLAGIQCALAFDNFTLITIFESVLAEISSLKTELAAAKSNHPHPLEANE
jgi:hypothetical protein